MSDVSDSSGNEQKLRDRCLLMLDQVRLGVPRRDVGKPIFLPGLTAEAARWAVMEGEVFARSVSPDAMTRLGYRLLDEPYALLSDPDFCESSDRLKFVGRVWMLGNIAIVRMMVELAEQPYSILGELGVELEQIRLPEEAFIDACLSAHRLMTGQATYQNHPVGMAFGISREPGFVCTGFEPLDQLRTISRRMGDDPVVAFRELLRTASPQLKDVLATVLHVGAFVYGEYTMHLFSLNSQDGGVGETADRSSQGGCLILLVPAVCGLACLVALVVAVMLHW